MRILVCISKTPDTTTKISFTDNNTKFNNKKGIGARNGLQGSGCPNKLSEELKWQDEAFYSDI